MIISPNVDSVPKGSRQVSKSKPKSVEQPAKSQDSYSVASNKNEGNPSVKEREELILRIWKIAKINASKFHTTFRDDLVSYVTEYGIKAVDRGKITKDWNDGQLWLYLKRYFCQGKRNLYRKLYGNSPNAQKDFDSDVHLLEAVDKQDGPLKTALKEERRIRVSDTVNQLPNKNQATVVRERYFNDNKVKQIAQEHGLPEAQVSDLLYKAKKLLFDMMIESDVA